MVGFVGVDRPPIKFDIGQVPADGIVYLAMWIVGGALAAAVAWLVLRGLRQVRETAAARPITAAGRIGGGLIRNSALLLTIALVVPVFQVLVHSTYQITILYYVALYVLLAIGLNIVVGYTGLLDLGFVAFFAVGGYTWSLLSSPQLYEITHQTVYLLTPNTGHAGLHISMILVLPLAGLVAAFFGVLIGIPTLRLRGDYLAIVTLGFGEIIRIFANNLDFPVNVTNGPRGVYDVDPIRIGAFDFGVAHDLPFSTPAFDLGPLASPGGPLTIPAYLNYYLLVLVLIMITVFFVSRLSTSRVGRAWAAIREDELAAEASGIHTRNLKLLAYASGGFFGGVAGATFAAAGKFIDPTLFGFDQSIFILVLVVVGGMGTIAGVIVGSVLVVEAFYNTAQAGSLRELVFGILLVIMIIIKPEGLLPSRQRKLELTEPVAPTDVPPSTDPLPDMHEAGA